MELAISPTRAGSNWRFTAFVRDITPLVRAEEQLRKHAAALTRTNEELEQFAYAVSHDLQEPLRNIGNYTQLLARKYASTHDQDKDELVTTILAGVERTSILLNDLLVYAQAVKMDAIAPYCTSAAAALDDAIKQLGASITPDMKITCDGLPSVRVLHAHLVQVFQNLLSNAIKYRQSHVAPEVHVSAQLYEDSRWQLSVQDNGIGILPQYHERIFGIFKRLHTRTEYPGTGLGLALVKKIIERYGGTIRVESTHGRGSTFIFTLPA